MNKPTQIIDINSDAGKNFLKNVEKLKEEMKLNGKGEKVRQHRELTEEQISQNSFLGDFMTSDIFKHFEIKRISLGNFGRKAGYQYRPIEENLFRFVVHLGDPEVYYISDDMVKDKPIPLVNGEGFIISSISAPQTEVLVYADPLRIIHDFKIQSQIPKIRPRNYSRTTLIYDVLYNIPEELLQEGEDIINELQETNKKEDCCTKSCCLKNNDKELNNQENCEKSCCSDDKNEEGKELKEECCDKNEELKKECCNDKNEEANK